MLDRIERTLAGRESMIDRLPGPLAKHAARNVAALDAATGDAEPAAAFLRDAMPVRHLPHRLPLKHTLGDITQWATRMADEAQRSASRAVTGPCLNFGGCVAGRTSLPQPSPTRD